MDISQLMHHPLAKILRWRLSFSRILRLVIFVVVFAGARSSRKSDALAAELDRFLAAEDKVSTMSATPVGDVPARKKAVTAGRATSKKKKRHRRLSGQQLRDKNQCEADNSKILNLTLDVNGPRQQVHDCLVEKSLWETRQLVARQQFNARSLQSVEHFFHIFQYGYP